MLLCRGDNQGLQLNGNKGYYSTSQGGKYTWKLTVCDYYDRCDSAIKSTKFKGPKQPKSELNNILVRTKFWERGLENRYECIFW